MTPIVIDFTAFITGLQTTFTNITTGMMNLGVLVAGVVLVGVAFGKFFGFMKRA